MRGGLGTCAAFFLLLGSASVGHAQLRASAPPGGLSQECDDLDLEPLAAALAKEHAILSRRASAPLHFGARNISSAEYARSSLSPLMALAGAKDRAALCRALENQFDFYHAASKTLFTGYHTPSVRGSLTEDSIYRFPLYRRPAGADALRSTEEILAGALVHRGYELLWLADPYDVLALHVEGSARVILPDGRALAVGTDGNNGRPYVNVSKLLIAEHKLPSGPAPPAIGPGNPKARRYFAEHPEELNRTWARNPHYVFFRTSSGPSGRMGALTAGRSIAVDPNEIPLGAVLLIRAQRPIVDVSTSQVTGWKPYSRLVLAQDTGAGIRGPDRIDVYFGDDAYAQVAGTVATIKGDAWVLVGR